MAAPYIPDWRERRQQRDARVESVLVLARRPAGITLPEVRDTLHISDSYAWGLLQTCLRRKHIAKHGTRPGRGRAATVYRAQEGQP